MKNALNSHGLLIKFASIKRNMNNFLYGVNGSFCLNRYLNRKFHAVFIFFLAVFVICTAGNAGTNQPVVLATTFPVFQITRNVATGGAFKVELMLPSNTGCPHDYSLTPKDMIKLEKASVLVMNGLGMEEFLHGALKKKGPSLKVVDSSRGITDLIIDEAGGHADHIHVNPHLFVSPGMAGILAVNIARGLSEIDSKNAPVYHENARAYAEKMELLNQKIRLSGKRVAHRQIMAQHGVFDYLARDMGLVIASVLPGHGDNEPSASEMLDLVKKIRAKKIRAIIIDPSASPRAANTLSRETKIPVVVIDPGLSGPADADMAYFETIMNRNLKTLENVLGEGNNND